MAKWKHYTWCNRSLRGKYSKSCTCTGKDFLARMNFYEEKHEFVFQRPARLCNSCYQQIEAFWRSNGPRINEPDFGGNEPDFDGNEPDFDENGPDFGGNGPDLGGGEPDLGGGGPDLGGGEPDLGGGGPDLEGGGPDLAGGEPDLGGGGPDLEGGEPDLGGGGPDLEGGEPDLGGGGPGLGGGGPGLGGGGPDFGGNGPALGGREPDARENTGEARNGVESEDRSLPPHVSHPNDYEDVLMIDDDYECFIIENTGPSLTDQLLKNDTKRQYAVQTAVRMENSVCMEESNCVEQSNCMQQSFCMAELQSIEEINFCSEPKWVYLLTQSTKYVDFTQRKTRSKILGSSFEDHRKRRDKGEFTFVQSNTPPTNYS